MAAMAPERTRTLHNFTLPSRLKWGVQRHLRCSKSNPNADDDNNEEGRRSSSSTSSRIRRRDPDQLPERKRRTFNDHHPPSPANRRELRIGQDEIRTTSGIEVMREKLMIDLQTEVDKMKIAILGEDGGGNRGGIDDRDSTQRRRSSPARENGSNIAVGKEDRPWNLRTRRSVFKEPNSNGNNGRNLRVEESGNCSAVMVQGAAINWESRGCGGGGGGGGNGIGGGFYVGGSSYGGCEKGERAKFSVTLTKQEIEEDFMAVIGRRPQRKPKRRPKYVQKQLDTLFPGLWLSEITTDMYKVNEVPESAGKMVQQ